MLLLDTGVGKRPMGMTVSWVPQGSRLAFKVMGGPGPSSSSLASEQQQCQQEENDNGMRPPEYDNETGWPKFQPHKAMGGVLRHQAVLLPHCSMTIAWVPQGFQQISTEAWAWRQRSLKDSSSPIEQYEPSTAAQHMQQRQDGHHKRRGKHGGDVPRM